MSLKVQLQSADVLTDVLHTLRLRSRVFCITELSAPWAMAFPSGPLAHFHAVERGGGWIRLRGGGPAVPLASGDLVIVTDGRGHVLADSMKTKAVPLGELLERKAPEHHVLRVGGGGAETHMVCGSFVFENAASNPLLSLLPPLLHIRNSGGRTHDWLEPTLRILASEARQARQGSGTIVTRLTDVILVQAIRAWIEEQPPGRGGWLGALRDRQIGAALGLIHQEPERAWSVATLAAAVGMSRSPFAAKFTALVGEPPLSYATRWRMHLAASLVQTERVTVAEMAQRAGYASEAAFSRAFKRQFGVSPSDYRARMARPADRDAAA